MQKRCTGLTGLEVKHFNARQCMIEHVFDAHPGQFDSMKLVIEQGLRRGKSYDSPFSYLCTSPIPRSAKFKLCVELLLARTFGPPLRGDEEERVSENFN